MSDPWGAHAQACGFAIAELQGLQHFLGAAREKADQTVGAIIMATGEQNTTESGRNAVEHAAAVRDRIPEMIGMLEVAVQEMRRYRGGF